MKGNITFYGGDSQVGTTMVALAAAEMLVRKCCSVLFISASQNPGNPFIQKNTPASLDDLRPVLRDGTLEETELRQCLVTSRGVDILPGVRSWQSSKAYGPDALLKIRQWAGERYDYVIADGGSSLEGLSAAALQGSSLACIVITQQEKSLDRLRTRLPLMQAVLPPHCCYVINKFQDSRVFYSIKELETRIGCSREQLIRIDYVPYGWQAEKDCKTLLGFRPFRKGITALTAYMEEEGEHLGV